MWSERRWKSGVVLLLAAVIAGAGMGCSGPGPTAPAVGASPDRISNPGLSAAALRPQPRSAVERRAEDRVAA